MKPFDTEELLARLEAVLRRSRKESESVTGMKDRVLEYKNIRIQQEHMQVQVKGQEVTLTKREYLILELLMSYPGKVFKKSFWGRTMQLMSTSAISARSSLKFVQKRRIFRRYGELGLRWGNL